MLTQQHRQEALSLAFIQAVAGRYGCSCSDANFDYGVDIQLHYVETNGRKYFQTGDTIAIQAKSTYDFEINEHGEVVYDLDIDAYNSLVRTDRGTPKILVLYCMPSDEGVWLSINAERTILQHCAYWVSLRGEAPSANANTQRIKIPGEQIFDAPALAAMFDRVRAGGHP